MTYVVRLRPNAEPPASAAYTLGKVHLLDPERGRTGGPNMTSYAWMGAPTRCGKELEVVQQRGAPWAEPPSDSRAVLHFTDVVQLDQRDNLCEGCFGPEPRVRWAHR